MAVKVVTDSTSDLAPDLAESLGITVVPCNVQFGTESLKDGVDILADEFYERLTVGPVHPTTSQPSPGDFVEVFDRLGEEADGIVSVQVSAKLSGTYNSAIWAKEETTGGHRDISPHLPHNSLISLNSILAIRLLAQYPQLLPAPPKPWPLPLPPAAILPPEAGLCGVLGGAPACGRAWGSSEGVQT